MELFITNYKLPVPKTIKPEIPKDIHGEDRVLGYCEICWHYDYTIYLTGWHQGDISNHVLAHPECIARSEIAQDWEYCTC